MFALCWVPSYFIIAFPHIRPKSEAFGQRRTLRLMLDSMESEVKQASMEVVW